MILPRPQTSLASLNARRWDVLVLGGAISGLVAAIRIAAKGQRVLIVEEDEVARGYAGLREPFFAPGKSPIIQSCLKALNLPLIDVQRRAGESASLQVVLPDARVDVGQAGLTAQELVTWGLAKPEEANSLVEALREAGTREQENLMAAPLLRGGRLSSFVKRVDPRGAGTPTGKPSTSLERGLPREAHSPIPSLAPFLEALIRGLSESPSSLPSSEAQAQLLGNILEAGRSAAESNDPVPGEKMLRLLLRQRLQTLHAEFRTISGPFQLVELNKHPGIIVHGGHDAWLGKVLILNAPLPSLARAMRDWECELPAFLEKTPAAAMRRVTRHFRANPDAIPTGMAARVIRVGDLDRPLSGPNLMRIRQFSSNSRDWIHLIASTTAEDSDAARAEAQEQLEAGLEDLMPFSRGNLVEQRLPKAVWDDDALPEGWPEHKTWPPTLEIRLSSQPPVYKLPDQEFEGLGAEGAFLLGWRAGDLLSDTHS